MNDTELSRLLAAERHVVPSDLQRERGRERLLSAVSAGAVPMAISSAPLAATTGAAVAAKLVVGVGAAGVVGAAVAGSVLMHGEHARHAVEQAAPRASVSVGVAASSVPPPSSARAAPVPEQVVESGRSVASAASSASTFDDELRLIEAAKRELDAGRGYLATVWLDEHARRYPHGVFQSERAALRVLVACSSEPAAAQRSAAAVFQRAYPASPFLDRIWRACGGEADGDAGFGTNGEKNK